MKRKQPVPTPATPPPDMPHPEDVPGAFLAEDTAVLYGASDAVTRVKHGLPLREFDALREMLGLTVEDLATRIGISAATLSRRRREEDGGRLDPEHSDRLMRYARLYWQAVQLLGGHEDSARAWLKRPARALDGATPLDFADTEVGGREVETLIQRLEHGVYT
jgi:putative toxin-antitoxin system antitoxin component (TIGR02293 family)